MSQVLPLAAVHRQASEVAGEAHAITQGHRKANTRTLQAMRKKLVAALAHLDSVLEVPRGRR